MLRNPILPLLLATLLSFTPASASGPSLQERVDQALAPIAPHLSGTLSLRLGDETYTRGFGLANDETGAVNGPDTRFLIASNTKQLAAAAILRLEEADALQVSQPVAGLFPEYPAANLTGKNGTPATIEHLLRHQAALEDVYELPEIRKLAFQQPYGMKEILAALSSRALLGEPGVEHKYSNTGYLLLGEIVRRKSGLSFGGFLQREFFGPAGITTATTGLPPPGAPLAQSYVREGASRTDIVVKHDIREWHVDDTFADGNVFISAPDLVRWLVHLQEGRALRSESLRRMFTPSLGDYGYGWMIQKDEKGREIRWHGGAWLAYRSGMYSVPSRRLHLVFLGNEVPSRHVEAMELAMKAALAD